MYSTCLRLGVGCLINIRILKGFPFSYCNIFLNLIGATWRRIGSRQLNQVESGPNGQVYGVDQAQRIYYRLGVSKRRMFGSNWIHIKGRLRVITAGCNGVFGVTSQYKVFRYTGKIKLKAMVKHFL